MNISFFTILKDGLLSAPKIGWRTTSPVNKKHLIFVSRFLFIPERSCVLHAFLLLAFAYLPFYKNAIRRIRLQIGFANLLLHPLTSNLLPFFYARSRESNMDSCQPVNAKRSHRLKNGVAIFADSKQSLRPLSFLSRTGNVLHAFHLQSFCILVFLKENIPLHSCNLQRLHRPENPSGFLLSKDKVLSLLATSLLNRNPYGFPINGSPVF